MPKTNEIEFFVITKSFSSNVANDRHEVPKRLENDTYLRPLSHVVFATSSVAWISITLCNSCKVKSPYGSKFSYLP